MGYLCRRKIEDINIAWRIKIYIYFLTRLTWLWCFVKQLLLSDDVRGHGNGSAHWGSNGFSWVVVVGSNALLYGEKGGPSSSMIDGWHSRVGQLGSLCSSVWQTSRGRLQDGWQRGVGRAVLSRWLMRDTVEWVSRPPEKSNTVW